MNGHCQLLYLTQKPHLVINETHSISQIFANAGEDTISDSISTISEWRVFLLGCRNESQLEITA